MKIIDFNTFIEKYKPIQNPFTVEGSYDNTSFETYDKELEFVKNFIESNQVWTLISGEDEEDWIMPGYNLVDRMNYFITDVSFTEKELENLQVNCNEMISVLDACEHCYKFGLSIDIALSVNQISDYYQQYKSEHTSGFVTIGEAKYRCMELIEKYFEDNFMEQTELDDEQQDKLHDYFSQL